MCSLGLQLPLSNDPKKPWLIRDAKGAIAFEATSCHMGGEDRRRAVELVEIVNANHHEQLRQEKLEAAIQLLEQLVGAVRISDGETIFRVQVAIEPRPDSRR